MEKSDYVVYIQARQGWTDETLLLLALEYIRDNGSNRDFEEYLEIVADEESMEGD